MRQTTGELTVSVVIPTYNRAEMLRSAIESVLVQSVPVREIAVADDGSTDHTRDMASALITVDAPLIYVPKPTAPEGAGPCNRRSAARNRGVAATTGEIVAFLDSDDVWEPQRVERQLAALKERDVGFAFCNLQTFDDSGPLGAPFLNPGVDYSGCILGDMLLEPLAVSSTLMVRREALDEVGGWAEDVDDAEDYELALRLAARYQAAYTPHVLVMMRHHAHRTSRSHKERPLLAYINIVESFLARHLELPRSIRVQGKSGLANVHFKLARYYLGVGDRRVARRHLRALIRLRPWDRRAPVAFLHTLLPGGRW